MCRLVAIWQDLWFSHSIFLHKVGLLWLHLIIWMGIYLILDLRYVTSWMMFLTF